MASHFLKWNDVYGCMGILNIIQGSVACSPLLSQPPQTRRHTGTS
jgi:hypothetical protein